MRSKTGGQGLVKAINRAPIDQGATEAIYEVRLTTSAEYLDENRELLRERLESANYPPQDIEVIEREQGDAKLVATLMGTTANPGELDEIVSRPNSILVSKMPAGACERRNSNGHRRSIMIPDEGKPLRFALSYAG